MCVWLLVLCPHSVLVDVSLEWPSMDMGFAPFRKVANDPDEVHLRGPARPLCRLLARQLDFVAVIHDDFKARLVNDGFNVRPIPSQHGRDEQMAWT